MPPQVPCTRGMIDESEANPPATGVIHTTNQAEAHHSGAGRHPCNRGNSSRRPNKPPSELINKRYSRRPNTLNKLFGTLNKLPGNISEYINRQ